MPQRINLITPAPTRYRTVIVSRPGIMQQSLRASLAACPPIVVVASLGDGLSALNYAAAHKPRPAGHRLQPARRRGGGAAGRRQALQLPTRCLVLTRSHQQRAWALAAAPTPRSRTTHHSGSYRPCWHKCTQATRPRPDQKRKEREQLNAQTHTPVSIGPGAARRQRGDGRGRTGAPGWRPAAGDVYERRRRRRAAGRQP